MKLLLDDVKAFHEICDLPIVEWPQYPSKDRIKLQRNLILEEFNELWPTLYETGNLAEAAKEMADLIYVVVGCAIEFGIPLDKVWNEVQKSNMSKADPETGRVKKREDGKILKPDNYTPPNIEVILNGP